jgi:predicted alpha/beta hydrolase
MKLKLKEEPKEWLKFTAVMTVMAVAMAVLLHRRKIIGIETLVGIAIAMALAMGACAIRPRWFRGFYRVGMTASFRVGQALGRVWLTLFFLLVLTPLGLLLRAFGKDLLAMKRRKTDTYWRAARPPGGFDQQF